MKNTYLLQSKYMDKNQVRSCSKTSNHGGQCNEYETHSCVGFVLKRRNELEKEKKEWFFDDLK